MKIVHTIAELREHLRDFERPSFVPTMGNLHAGHLKLVDQAKPLGDVCVASIFVNRLQFAPHEDFDSYPRTFEADCAQLQAHGCDILFAPDERELYPQKQTFKVTPDPALDSILEGEFRPGFFQGVATVVMKLFQCVFTHVRDEGHAVFGEKDFQQLMVIRHLVQQFALPIRIHGGAIVRADDGLALSSRNGYLDASERTEAVALSRTLRAMIAKVQSGERNWDALESTATAELKGRGWAPDYLTVRRRHDLQLPQPDDRELVALGAARLGPARLIDNWSFDLR
jgi:pantoate--beta-alanine ligase